MNQHEILFFSIFLVIIIAILFVDLKVIGRKSHKIKLKEALLWTTVWISLSVLFYFFLRHNGDWLHDISSLKDIEVLKETYKIKLEIEGLSLQEAIVVYNKNISLEYITGYLIEYALSVDNVFVMILIFMAFNVSEKYYKGVLFWGILGAIIMRFLFIFLSAALIQRFEWVLFIFGGFLVFTGIKMFLNRNSEGKINVEHHPVVRFASKRFRVFPKYVGSSFFIRKNGKRYITPLFIVLLVIEFTDVIFAVDSVPAIFSITKDPYIVFFSNIFAIIGLRSLFFLVLHVINLFHYLKIGLAVLLTFVGVKMLIHHQLEKAGFTTTHSLLVVLGILVISIVASLLFPLKEKSKTATD